MAIRNFMGGYGPSVPPLPLVVQSGLAILRIDGPMMMGWGWQDPECVAATIDKAATDQSIRTLLLDMNCPGGSAFGTADLEGAAKRYKASGKRLCAIAHDQLCSSAYWLGSYADEIVATHSAMVGSIGTIMTLYDDSQRFATEGVRPVVIELPGTMKRMGLPGVPITAEHEARTRATLAIHNATFRNAVAMNRGIAPESIDAMGGAAFIAAEALQNKLIDRVVDYREYVAELMNQSNNGPASVSAENAANVAAPENQTMPETKPPSNPQAVNMTEEEMRQKFPDIVAGIEAKAKASVNSEAPAEPAAESEEEPAMPPENRTQAQAAQNAATLAELKAIAPNDLQFAVDCYEAGMTIAQAKLIYSRTAKPENKAATPAPGRGVSRPVAPRQPSNEGPGSWEDAVQHVMTRDRCKRGKAITTAAHEFRDLHAAYVENQRRPENQVVLMEQNARSTRVTAADANV